MTINKLKIALMGIFSLIMISGCSSDDENPCSNADNINSAECQRNIPNINDRPLSLDIKFKDSYFYNQSSREWVTLQKNNLTGGVIGQVLPIYSNFLNIATSAASPKIHLAQDQFERQGAYPTADYNTIPYIEVEYESGVDYIYNYTKRDLNNNIIFEKTGEMIIYQNRALLPMINAMFDNQFYSATNQVGSRFIHTIAIAAQSRSQRGATTATIEFETSLQIPNTDFYIEYADDAKNFNVKDRWSSFYKNSQDFVVNDLFKFVTLKEIKDVPEQVPIDIKVVFKEPPKLRLQQEVFFEMPLDLDALKANNRVVPQRGYSFYTQKNEFNSDNDFRMKIRLNNQFVTLVSQREFEALSLPPGTKWDMEFFYDFTQNPLYNGLDGKGLLTPLKPICQEIANSPFAPLQEESEKQIAINNGGFIGICHPQSNGKLIIPPEQMASTTYDLNDTWFKYFSYAPFDSFNKNMGHFYGVRRVSFLIEGCVRVFARQASTGNYELKSESSPACQESGDPEGWVYFSAERTSTIFDHINEYDGVSGLKSLIQFFGSRPVRQTPNFKINGDINNGRHIY